MTNTIKTSSAALTNLTSFGWVVYYLIGCVFGMDKASIKDRFAKFKSVGDNFNFYEEALKIEDQGERIVALNAVDAYYKVKAGVPVDNFIFLDECSSGAMLMSAITRCTQGLKSVGTFNKNIPGNLYQDMCDEYNVLTGDNISKKVFKKVTLQFYYQGNAALREMAQGDDSKIQAYHTVYAKYLPKAYEYRNACFDAWDANAFKYYWEMPDGYEISIPVNVLKQGEAHFFNEDGYEQKVKMFFQELGNKLPNEDGTRCLGAHSTHGMDAFLMRELIAMSHYTKEDCLAKLASCANSNKEPSKLVNRFIDLFRTYNIVCARFWGYVQDCKLPADFYSAMEELALRMPEESFDMVHIHDEFGVLPQHVNQMRKNCNWIVAQLYRSNLMEYFSNNVGRGIKVKANPYDEEVYQAILNSDFILS